MPKRLMHLYGEEPVLPVQPLLSRNLMTKTVVYHARTEFLLSYFHCWGFHEGKVGILHHRRNPVGLLNQVK